MSAYCMLNNLPPITVILYLSGISSVDCIHLPNVAQPNPTMVTTNRITKSNVDCFISRIILQTISAIVVGSRQYPRTHTLWKNDLK